MSLAVEKLGLFFKVLAWTPVAVTPAILRALLYTYPAATAKFLALQTWDLGLFLGNILTPQKKKGTVVKPGLPGHGGVWPEWQPPTKGDSRSPCPYLNALANHGILPHDGKNINLVHLGNVIVDSLNFSHTLVKDTVAQVAATYRRDHIDLGDLAAHNVIEHDASLIRHDAYWKVDQTIPAKDLIKDMLDSATGPVSPEHPEGYLTPADLSRCLSLREARSKRDNPVFQLDVPHRFFGASNATLMYETVKGDVKTLKTILYEEKFPEGFESCMRERFGYTMKEFHMRSLEIVLGMKTPKLAADDIRTEDAIKKADAQA